MIQAPLPSDGPPPPPPPPPAAFAAAQAPAAASKPHPQRTAILEALAGIAVAFIGTELGLAHQRSTGHVSGLLVGLAALAYCTCVLLGALAYNVLSERTQRLTRGAGHAIVAVFALGLLIVLAIAGGAVGWPADGGTSRKQTTARPRARTRNPLARAALIVLGLIVAVVLLFFFSAVGVGLGEAISGGTEVGTWIGLIAGLGLPIAGGWLLLRRHRSRGA